MFELLVAHFGTSALVPGDLYSFLLFSVTPMAASSSNKMETPDPDWDLLQPNLPINQVDWDLVKTYLFDRFTTPPTEFIQRQGQTIIPDVHPNRICEHIMHFRPCPSFVDPAYRCPGYHPEFLLQGPDVIWTPRTWSCRAFQRRTDLAHQDHCHRPECQQLHRPGWAHSELVAFRSWALSVHRAYWFTIYCCQPNINGKTPLYVTHYQDIQHCLTNQAYLPYADFIKHSWKETVEPPLTYLLDTPSHVPPFAANYYDDERVQQRRVQRQRSQTPRRPRPAQAAPEPTEAQTSTNFLPNNTQRPSTTVHASPRFGQGTPPRSRQPTGSDHTRPTSSFPTPSATPTSFAPPMPAPSTTSPSPISAPCSIPVVPPSPSYTTQWPPTSSDPWAEPDSDGLPTPAANLRVTAPPNLEPSHALQISLQESRYNFFTQPIPRAYFRDFTNYLSSGGEQFAPFANWQIPTRLLSDTYALLRRNYNDEGSSNTMTWWGLLSRQSSLHPDQREYTEQTLTIPLPTNTADPEIAILTSFFYTKMNQERALAFQTNPGNPVETTQTFLKEWLSFAGDQYRLSLNQRGTSARFSYNVASVILDLLTANIPEHQRVWADSDPNIQVDPISGRLQFHRWDETAVNHLSEVVESRRWATTDCCTADLSPISFDTPGPKWHRVNDSRWDMTHELGTESHLSIHTHQFYVFMFWNTFLSQLWFCGCSRTDTFATSLPWQLGLTTPHRRCAINIQKGRWPSETHMTAGEPKTSDEANTLFPSHRFHKIDTTRSHFTTKRTHSQFHHLPRDSRFSFINPWCFPNT